MHTLYNFTLCNTFHRLLMLFTASIYKCNPLWRQVRSSNTPHRNQRVSAQRQTNSIYHLLRVSFLHLNKLPVSLQFKCCTGREKESNTWHVASCTMLTFSVVLYLVSYRKSTPSPSTSFEYWVYKFGKQTVYYSWLYNSSGRVPGESC